MKKTFVYLLLVLFLVTTVLAGCGFQENPSTFVLSGSIEGETYGVQAEVPGKLVKLLVAEGDEVKPGQEIAVLDGEAAKLEADAAAAALTAVEARLAEAKSGSRREEISSAAAQVAQLQALAKGAETTFTLKKKAYDRASRLFAEGALSEEQLERARMELDSAASQFDSLKNQVQAAAARQELLEAGATPESIASLEAQVSQARSALELARLRVTKTMVRSPAAGVVLSKNFTNGEMVTVGANIATLIDVNDLWIKVYIPENRLNMVHLGQKVKVRVDSFPDRFFPGEVVQIYPQAEFTPKNVQTPEERINMVFPVKIKVDGEGVLKPGMPADVEL